ncbi:uncharacterized protein LAESUDRAFT_738485 [Laetiporus sulphureus 93-53]|uniref:DUF6589 domain-containing protein n=1 Tax=Laetiporus sulphureus 93-53 TaxID=1314785 RepID=A0A165CGH9_9APHY|nr:uncharacterized protein LAESUDRAFT_738485 [Laetiporus sulphureus 93-53]KZT02766.1 hypothetical protein LAESUDRAFT_738485 [Laetiporus sulphureus 93-53]
MVDLSTCERVQSILKVRSIEETPWKCYQFVVFVPGLFHLKMACADAIYKALIHPPLSRLDENSMMHFVGIMHPKETGKIRSNPKFHQMHEVIGHTGIALRLDAWCVEVARRHNMSSLEDYAKSEPSMDALCRMADTLAQEYVHGEGMGVFDARRKAQSARDQQHENVLLMHQYLLLYEEITYAMNAGDIGRVEAILPSWITIFKATGKHKYANQMQKFLAELHFVYPSDLRHAIRMNILINPTGKVFAFRGVDWVVELNNLFTKDKYGGSGPNYTKDHVISESPNIMVYRSCASNAECNYHLNGLTSAHGKKNITKTFDSILTYMWEHGPNEHKAGCKASYTLRDMIDKGMEALLSTSIEEETAVEGINEENTMD